MLVIDKFNEKQREEWGLFTEKLELFRSRVENCPELSNHLPFSATEASTGMTLFSVMVRTKKTLRC
jgi:hypothetical protein